MFQNRFQDLQQDADFNAGSTFSNFPFCAIPICSLTSGSPAADPAFGSMAWMYQQAFESARQAVLARRQRETYAASLN